MRARDEKKNTETYHTMATHGRGSTRSILSKDIDIMAVFIEPVDAWYIIPRSAITTPCMRFYPNPVKKISKWEVYRNNWSPFYATKEKTNNE